jgi:hypothetical protein
VDHSQGLLEPVVDHLPNVIFLAAANRFAVLSWEIDDPATVSWSAHQALGAVAQPDEGLLGHLLRAAAAADGKSALAQTWRGATARYASVSDVPSADLVALYDQL